MNTAPLVRSWPDVVVDGFPASLSTVCRVSIAIDPDDLLADERVLAELHRRGFQPAVYDDPVAFRLLYETGHAPGIAATSGLVVVFRGDETDVENLPYDILAAARRDDRVVKLSLTAVLPELDAAAVRKLDRSDLDLVHDAIRVFEPGKLSPNATADFLLRNVFQVPIERLRRPEDVLAALMDIHAERRTLPEHLADRLVRLVSRQTYGIAWPLRALLVDRSAFLAFLLSAWKTWLRRHDAREVGEPSDAQPEDRVALPFEAAVVRMRVDTWFLDGALPPVRIVAMPASLPAWARVGVRLQEQEPVGERCRRAWQQVQTMLPDGTASRLAWGTFARAWGDFLCARSQARGAIPDAEVEPFHDDMEQRFWAWLQDNFAGLACLSHAAGPVMVHHAVGYIAKRLGDKGKAALIVMDGLALDQWACLRDDLVRELGSGVRYDERVIWAWIPTLTSVSRQAIFRGEPPYAFPDSFGTTSKERKHFETFWADRGISSAAVEYRVQGHHETFGDFERDCLELAGKPKARVVGVVVNYIDAAAHGIPGGSDALRSFVRSWAATGQLHGFIQSLLDRGFTVYLTADHGNIEARGAGRSLAGSTADERGERSLQFPNALLRDQVVFQHAHALTWPSDRGLPGNVSVVVAAGRSAFLTAGDVAICHGGAALEEVAVPFVTFEREAR